MTTSISTPDSTQPFTTFFNNKTNQMEYLIGQTVFSTVFGFAVCRLPFLQSIGLGIATEGCRKVTDQAIEHLVTKFPYIREYKTVVKTALVAGSFFLGKIITNLILGSSPYFQTGILMGTTYLLAEPIVKGVRKACKNEIIRQILTDIGQDIHNQYSTVIKKTADLCSRSKIAFLDLINNSGS